jgi:chemotaxis protein MotB
MARNAPGTIIIKRIKKGGHAAHHGGAWKVAYADFVTAMMAFFLLLWLLNVTTDVQKRGIADYFDPSISWQSSVSGANGVLGGRTVGPPGSMIQAHSAPTLTMPMPSMRESDDDGDEADATSASNPTSARDEQSDKEFERRAAAREEKQFAAAEFALRQAIQDVPELRELADSLIVDRTQEGLRVQIVDQDKVSMFPLGTAEMHPEAKRLMALVAQVVQKLPNKISVTGHTDSTPFAKGGSYGNWELSTDRANASRRELLQAGLAPERIAKVVGRADQEPLVADDPASPRNRRISVVLLREAKPPAAQSAQAAQR